ncbi:MAG: cytidylate kinase-like family protein [Alphaproteobacteria bacterium]
MAVSVQQAIRAMVVAAHTEPREQRERCPDKPVIVLSRDYGSGGDEIARRLAERFGVPVYDREILEAIAQRLDADEVALRQLDESIDKGRYLWLYRLITSQDVSFEAYRRTLINVILGLARVGGVIVGRGAHVVLFTHCALRLRICGTSPRCARRVAEAEGLDLTAARVKVLDINRNRARFVWDYFRSRLNDPSQFDLILNTDRTVSLEAAADALAAMVAAVYRPEP